MICTVCLVRWPVLTGAILHAYPHILAGTNRICHRHRQSTPDIACIGANPPQMAVGKCSIA